MGKDDQPAEEFFFYPHDWIASGYHLTGIDDDLVEGLETCKKQYMEERGYMEDSNTGYDAGLDRTARLLVEPQDLRTVVRTGVGGT